MSLEIIVPILVIVAGGILVFLLRKWSELPAPQSPRIEFSEHQGPPLGPGESDRILITHPFIRRAAEKALAAGGKPVRYISKEGEQIYFSFQSIEDPVQRAKAVELIKGIEKGGNNMNLIELIQLVRRLFK